MTIAYCDGRLLRIYIFSCFSGWKIPLHSILAHDPIIFYVHIVVISNMFNTTLGTESSVIRNL